MSHISRIHLVRPCTTLQLALIVLIGQFHDAIHSIDIGAELRRIAVNVIEFPDSIDRCRYLFLIVSNLSNLIAVAHLEIVKCLVLFRIIVEAILVHQLDNKLCNEYTSNQP
jgi:hypothetical protein